MRRRSSYLNIRASMWHFKEECDRLSWKFHSGRLTREEMDKFCSVFCLMNLSGFGGAGLPILSLVVSSNQSNFNSFSFAGSPGFPADVRLTNNSGIYIFSTSTAVAGFDIGAGWSSGTLMRITNNGFIIGKGGAGGSGSASAYASSPIAPGAGGNAMILRTGVVLQIDNASGYIAGGGGGGGYLANFVNYGPGYTIYGGGGGGAGGGDGGATVEPTSVYGGAMPSTGGAGGGVGAGGGNGNVAGAPTSASGGGGGGRVLPGTGGGGSPCTGGYQTSAAQGGGAGGGGGMADGTYGCSGSGGGGGSSNGAGGGTTGTGAGGGGGWGAAGGSGNGSGGAAGGKAVELNGFTVSFINAGNTYGAVS